MHIYICINSNCKQNAYLGKPLSLGKTFIGFSIVAIACLLATVAAISGTVDKSIVILASFSLSPLFKWMRQDTGY